jgi:amino acid permease
MRVGMLTGHSIINLFAVKWYGESEFWLASGKVILIGIVFCFTFITSKDPPFKTHFALVAGKASLLVFQAWRHTTAQGCQIMAREDSC